MRRRDRSQGKLLRFKLNLEMKEKNEKWFHFKQLLTVTRYDAHVMT